MFFEMEQCRADKNWAHFLNKLQVIKNVNRKSCSSIFNIHKSIFDKVKWSGKSEFSNFCQLRSLKIFKHGHFYAQIVLILYTKYWYKHRSISFKGVFVPKFRVIFLPGDAASTASRMSVIQSSLVGGCIISNS